MSHLEYYLQEDEINAVDLTIIQERNREVREIEEDIINIHEINLSLSQMLAQQGEQLDIAEQHVENTVIQVNEASENLSQTQEIVEKGRKLLRDVCIVGGGLVLGSLGLLLGPIVGIPTMVAGATLGTGVVFGIRKVETITSLKN